MGGAWHRRQQLRLRLRRLQSGARRPDRCDLALLRGQRFTRRRDRRRFALQVRLVHRSPLAQGLDRGNGVAVLPDAASESLRVLTARHGRVELSADTGGGRLALPQGGEAVPRCRYIGIGRGEVLALIVAPGSRRRQRQGRLPVLRRPRCVRFRGLPRLRDPALERHLLGAEPLALPVQCLLAGAHVVERGRDPGPTLDRLLGRRARGLHRRVARAEVLDGRLLLGQLRGQPIAGGARGIDVDRPRLEPGDLRLRLGELPAGTLERQLAGAHSRACGLGEDLEPLGVKNIGEQRLPIDLTEVEKRPALVLRRERRCKHKAGTPEAPLGLREVRSDLSVGDR